MNDGVAAFRRFELGQLVSFVGDGLAVIALPLLVLDATKSVQQMGFVGAAAGWGYLLSGFLANALVDRFSRRKLLLVCDVVQAALYALVPFAVRHPGWTLPALALLAFGGALFAGIFRVTSSTFVASLVPRSKLGAANARLMASFGLGNFLGPLLLAAIVPYVGLERALVINGFSFAISAVTLATVKEDLRRDDEDGARGGAIGGVRHVFADPVLRAVFLLLSAESFLLGGGVQLFLFHLRHDIGLDERAIGFVFGAASVGAIVGALAAPATRRALGFGTTFLGALLFQGMAGALVGRVGSLAAALVAAAAFAGAGSIVGVTAVTLRQERSPDAVRGRVNAAFWTAYSALAPVGLLVATTSAEHVGAPRVLALFGCATSVLAIGGFASAARAREP